MLKSIEISGFKSFADRTRMDFSEGISALVGPNGSGKSNIVDAIKWVLGEQSMKKLRGNEMVDVIFNGSPTRQPLGSAEVTITFENKNNIFGMDAKEVHFTRRIYRSGESEYLINRQASRLKDFHGLLNGTGLGSQAYSIIEQGRVESLLQSTSSQRRSVLEEAAGIAQFNAKKQEVQRRLERVQQNLLRLSDIVNELESQLRNTKSQAGKAQLYRQYTTRLQELRTEIGILTLRRNKDRIAEFQEELDRFNDCEEKCSTQIKQTESELQEYTNSLEKRETELRRVEGELTSIRERIASEESTCEFQFDQMEILYNETIEHSRQLFELKAKKGDMEEQMRTTEDDIFKAQKHLREVSDSYTTCQNELNGHQNNCDLLQKQKDSIQHNIYLINTEISRLSGVVSGLHTRQKVFERTKSTQQGKQADVRQQIKDINDRQTEFEKSAKTLKQQISEKTDVLHDLQDQLKEKRERQGEIRQNLEELKQQQTGLAERTALLEDLLEKREDLSPGVREVLENMDNPDSPFRHAWGLVADLILVNKEAAGLIGLALGASVEYVVIPPEKELLKYIEDNSRKFAGRVGFICIDPQAPEPERGKRRNYENEPGVLGRADQFVETDEKYGSLARRLLGRTWIVETLTHARALYAQSDGRTNFLTVSGECLTAEGALVVGPPHSVSGLIARRTELRTLSEQLEHLETNLAGQTNNFNQIQKEISALREQIDDINEELRQLQKTLNTLRLDQTAAQERIQQAQKYSKQLDTETLQLDSDHTQLLDELAQNEKSKKDQGDLLLEQKRQLDILQKQINSEATLRDKKIERVTELQIELAKSEERLDSLTERKSQLEDNQKERNQLLLEHRQRYQTLNDRKDSTEMTILYAESVLAVLYANKEKVFVRSRSVQKERKRLNSAKNKLQSELKKFLQEQAGNQEKKHLREMEIERLLQEQQTLEQRMRDDYGISLEEIMVLRQQKKMMTLEKHNNSTDRKKQQDGTQETEQVSDEKKTSSNLESTDDQTQGEVTDKPVDKDDPELELTMEEEEALIKDYQAEIEDLKNKLRKIGSVNLEALETLETLETRYTTMANQYNDLQTAQRSILKIIDRVNIDSQRLFQKTFDSVKIYFCDIFRKFFGGGHADLVLENPENPLESGIEIEVCPPGKELKKVSLLSGGEKTLTCVALLLAIFRYRVTPVCILDEVDAALDEGNVGRFAKVLMEFGSETQFLIITHSKKTMTASQAMYGVTMQEPGVSTLLAVEFDEVGENGEIVIRKGSNGNASREKKIGA